jgi:septum site-determining protein MinC
MSKITIVSRDDRALLIDISGCISFKEAIEQLSSTFLSANQFWQEQAVDLNLGSLLLSKSQASQIIALVNGVGAQPKQIFARSASTFAALEELGLPVTKEQPDFTNQESTVPIKAKENEKGYLSPATIDKVIVFDGVEQPVKYELNQLPLEVNTSLSTTELETSQDLLNKTSTPTFAAEIKKKNPLYLRQTLRAGQAVSHKGDLIIIGDVNAGAEVMAEGDITIWGSLRGIAHAGIDGDIKAEIRALRLQPIQIRIANYIARSPDKRSPSTSQNSHFVAEVAKLVDDKIRIVHKTFD